MKRTLVPFTLAIALLCVNASAQVVSKDSIQALNDRKQALEQSKELNDNKLKLAEKEKELAEKSLDASKATAKANEAVEANRQAAAELASNPQDKKLASKANRAARSAQNAAKSARKANDSVEKLSKELAELQGKIQSDTQRLAATPSSPAPAGAAVIMPAAEQTAAPQPVYAGSGSAGVVSGANSPNVMQRNITLDSANAGKDPSRIAQNVVESTYRNYPQQQGQPAIIINNIIVPPDYSKQPAAAAAPAAPTNGMYIPEQDRQEYEDYRAWLRYKRGEPAAAAPGAYPPPAYGDERPMTREERLTFRERFGEKPARNSGLWVIPMVGVHASNFNANFDDNEYDGRTGWNAGLDFRIRAKRFFVQPGIHYFNSSMNVTSNDSIAEAPLLTGPRVHSLKAPLLLGLYLTKANKGFFKFNIKGGVVGNYVLDVDNNDLATFDRDNIEDWSYGLNAGFGIEFGIVTFDFSHEWGMSRLFKDSNQKNNILRGTIGFKL